jgi:uncharacterized protein YneF (UPF0154 family)
VIEEGPEDEPPQGLGGEALGEPISYGDPITGPENELPLSLTPPAEKKAVGAEAFQNHQFHLTYWLLGVTVALTVGIITIALFVVKDSTWTRVNSQIGYLLTPFHTLLGIAIGYFFATKSDK